MKPHGASGLVLLWVLVVSCAHEVPVGPVKTPAEKAEIPEIVALERRIAEQKASLNHASGQPNQAAHDSTSAPMANGDAAAGGGRCDSVCQKAEEICTCYRRICRLASEAGDEKGAHSCRRGQKDCEEAGRTCAACR